MYKYLKCWAGRKQMVAVARALATGPSFIISMSRPLPWMCRCQGKIINLLIRLQNEFHLSYLFITHDLSLMRNVASRVAIMYLGKICEIAETVEFFRNPLHPTHRCFSPRFCRFGVGGEAQAQKIIPPVRSPARSTFPQLQLPLSLPMKTEVCTQLDPVM